MTDTECNCNIIGQISKCVYFTDYNNYLPLDINLVTHNFILSYVVTFNDFCMCSYTCNRF